MKLILLFNMLSNISSFSIQRRSFGKIISPLLLSANGKDPNITSNTIQIKDMKNSLSSLNIDYKSNSFNLEEEPQKITSQTNNIYIQNNENNVFYYGTINYDGCYKLKSLLTEIDNKLKIANLQYKVSNPTPIHLHIQSYGGELLPALNIIDLIPNLNSPVYTYVDGYAASAATLMSVVGKKRFMTKHSLMLIHQLSGHQGGKFQEMSDDFVNMNTLMTIIKDIYLNNTIIEKTILENILSKDIWLSSEMCLKYKLVDEII